MQLRKLGVVPRQRIGFGVAVFGLRHLLRSRLACVQPLHGQSVRLAQAVMYPAGEQPRSFQEYELIECVCATSAMFAFSSSDRPSSLSFIRRTRAARRTDDAVSHEARGALEAARTGVGDRTEFPIGRYGERRLQVDHIRPGVALADGLAWSGRRRSGSLGPLQRDDIDDGVTC